MKRKELVDDAAYKLYDYLEERGYDSYSAITLMGEYGYDQDDFSFEELTGIHERLIEILKEEGRSPEAEMSLVGSPYDVKVFLKKRKCPYCGSRDIAKIIYGYPVMSEEMEEEIAQGKIVLGGCLLREEKYYCNSCDRKFQKT